MSHVKGSMLIFRWQFLEKQGTREDVEKVLAGLPEDSASLFRAGILAGSWYPLRHFVHLNRALDAVLGMGDQSLIWQMGRWSAEAAASGAYRAFSKSGNPAHIFDHANSVWRQFYDSGHLRVVPHSSAHIDLMVEEFDEPAKELCLAVGGWIERNVELSGVEKVVVSEAQCQVRGDDHCRYSISWSSQPGGGAANPSWTS